MKGSLWWWNRVGFRKRNLYNNGSMKLSRMLKKLFYVILMCLLAPASWATTYYVCDKAADCNAGNGSGWSTGSDSNSAKQAQSKSTPWKTIDHAEENVSAGDTVIVGDGTYTARSEENGSYNLFIQTTGTAGNVITFKAENKHGAKIHGLNSAVAGIWFACAESPPPSYITIDGFEITDQKSYGIYIKNASGTDTQKCSNITLKNLKIQNLGHSGIHTTHIDRSTIEKNVISNCNKMKADNQYHGVYIKDYSTNVTIKNNIIYNITEGLPINVYGPKSSPTKITIVNNTMTDENDARDGCISIYGSVSTVFSKNICYSIASASRGGLIECDTNNTGIVAEYNLTNLPKLNSSSCDQDFRDSSPNTLNANLSKEFTDHSSRDYTQQSDALSIDAGTAVSDSADDYQNTSRPQGAADDIGAYEYVSKSPVSGNHPKPPLNVRIVDP